MSTYIMPRLQGMKVGTGSFFSSGCRTGSGRNTPPPAEIGPVRVAQLPTLLVEQVDSRVRASAIANSASSAQSHRRQVRGWVSVNGMDRLLPRSS